VLWEEKHCHRDGVQRLLFALIVCGKDDADSIVKQSHDVPTKLCVQHQMVKLASKLLESTPGVADQYSMAKQEWS
jgi:hypothetical protein